MHKNIVVDKLFECRWERTCENRVLNPLHPPGDGMQWGEAPGKKMDFVFADFVQNKYIYFFRNVWNLHGRSTIDWIEIKTKFVIFQIFIFRVVVIFVTSSLQFSMKFCDNSKNKNWRIFLLFFPFDSEHCAPFTITFWWGHFWGGGSACP